MSFILVHDAIHANISHLPKGQAAGYTTGSPDIRWTNADWAAHPGAVRICQDFGASDHTADVLDVEQGAATNTQAGPWYKNALLAYNAATRPGQRHPAIYTSAANVTPLVNALIAAGVHTGPNLWVANWNLSDAQATTAVAAASGPYPIQGVQFTSGAYTDTSVFSSSWLTAVSHVASTGPYRKVLRTKSVATLAAERHTTWQDLLAVTAKGYTAHDAGTIIDGMIIYTSNP